jgi:hypothetical protein
MLLLIVPEHVRDCLLCLLFILLELYCSLYWFYPSAFFLLSVFASPYLEVFLRLHKEMS